MAKKKRKLTTKEVGVVRKALEQVDALKEELAKKREELRAAFEDVEEILLSLEDADELITSGRRSISDGLDRMSEYL